MKKQILALLITGLISITGCASQETVKPYIKSNEAEKSLEGSVENENIATTAESSNEVNDNETIESSNETIESSNETVESSNETVNESETIENSNESVEVSSEQKEITEEEYIDNGAISDKNISMGKVYIGKQEFTVEYISTKFTNLSNYENNELTATVAGRVASYLTNLSEYDLINLWSEYDNLEKDERYALIVLTRYEQAFGGYNKNSMDTALSGSDIYEQDKKNIDSELK